MCAEDLGPAASQRSNHMCTQLACSNAVRKPPPYKGSGNMRYAGLPPLMCRALNTVCTAASMPSSFDCILQLLCAAAVTRPAGSLKQVHVRHGWLTADAPQHRQPAQAQVIHQFAESL